MCVALERNARCSGTASEATKHARGSLRRQQHLQRAGAAFSTMVGCQVTHYMIPDKTAFSRSSIAGTCAQRYPTYAEAFIPIAHSLRREFVPVLEPRGPTKAHFPSTSDQIKGAVAFGEKAGNQGSGVLFFSYKSSLEISFSSRLSAHAERGRAHTRSIAHKSGFSKAPK
jgi:hypothetical protein